MTSHLHRFTDSAQQILSLAANEAATLRQTHIGSEHLLLALIKDKNNLGAIILRDLNGDLSYLQKQLHQTLSSGVNSGDAQLRLTEDATASIDAAVDAANTANSPDVGTEHLLLGILQAGNQTTRWMLQEAGITPDAVQRMISTSSPTLSVSGASPEPNNDQQIPPPVPISDFNRPAPSSRKPPTRISPIFLLILGLTLISAYLSYNALLHPGLTVFLFVLSGWVVTLCLHEFGHAFAAYHGGDKSVIHKGYLTLNPLKYTHGTLSILMPLIFLAMGGIGLPGGAVYINMGAIKSRGMQSLVSAAGPLATAICAIILALPFLLDLADIAANQAFWAGVTLLAFLQITALVLNLLPFPGLDGFGIIAPFLPEAVLVSINRLGAFAFMILFMLLIFPSPFSAAFWRSIAFISSLAGLDFRLVSYGFSLFQFWQG